VQFERGQTGGAESTYPWGSTADGQAQRLTHAVPHESQNVSIEIRLSRFAAWPDCSGTQERRHGASADRPSLFGQGARRSFTASRLQSDASSTAASERPLFAGPCGRVAHWARPRQASHTERPVGGFEAQLGDEIG
jgi:hypothetical protein